MWDNEENIDVIGWKVNCKYNEVVQILIYVHSREMIPQGEELE